MYNRDELIKDCRDAVLAVRAEKRANEFMSGKRVTCPYCGQTVHPSEVRKCRSANQHRRQGEQ